MSRLVLAVDPGPERSALVAMLDGRPNWMLLEANALVLERIRKEAYSARHLRQAPVPLLLEWVAHYHGNPAGASTFLTARWIGRYWEAWDAEEQPVHTMTRPEVCLELCGINRAKKAQVNQALMAHYGCTNASHAKGTKHDPGPLYGVASHLWDAVALAVAWERVRGRNAGP